mgnify:CR=1 FL=1
MAFAVAGYPVGMLATGQGGDGAVAARYPHPTEPVVHGLIAIEPKGTLAGWPFAVLLGHSFSVLRRVCPLVAWDTSTVSKKLPNT